MLPRTSTALNGSEFFVGPANPQASIDALNWSTSGFFASTFTVSDRGNPVLDAVVSSGKRNARVFLGEEPKEGYVSKIKDRGFISYYSRPTGPGLAGIVHSGRSHATRYLSDYSHIKVMVADRGNDSIASVSTANFSRSAYEEQRNLEVVSKDKSFVRDVKQIQGWLTEGKLPSKLSNFWLTGVNPKTGESLGSLEGNLVNLINNSTGDIYITSANLRDRAVVEALQGQASAGRKVTVAVNENQDRGPEWQQLLSTVTFGLFGSNPNRLAVGIAESIVQAGPNTRLIGVANNQKKGLVHANVALIGDTSLVGDTRYNESMLGGSAASVTFVHKGDAKFNQAIKNWFDTLGADRQVSRPSHPTIRRSHSFYDMHLDAFMPEKFSEARTRFMFDPNIMRGARDYAIRTGIADINEIERAPGMAQALFRSLHHTRYGSYDLADNETPDSVKDFDKALQKRSIGQSDLWQAMFWGVQRGDRGPIDSMLVNVTRSLDRARAEAYGTFDPTAPDQAGTLETMVVGSYDALQNVTANVAGFYMVTLPVMRFYRDIAAHRKELLTKLATSHGFSQVGTGLGMINDRADTVMKRWAGILTEELFLPTARYLGPEIKELMTEVGDMFWERDAKAGAESKSFHHINYEVHEAFKGDSTEEAIRRKGSVDRALQNSILRPLSSAGLGRPFAYLGWGFILDGIGGLFNTTKQLISGIANQAGIGSAARHARELGAIPLTQAGKLAYMREHGLLDTRKLEGFESLMKDGKFKNQTAQDAFDAILYDFTSPDARPWAKFKYASDSFRSHLRGGWNSLIGLDAKTQTFVTHTKGGFSNALIAGTVGAVILNKVLGDIGSAGRSTVRQQYQFKALMDSMGAGSRSGFGMYYSPGWSTYNESMAATGEYYAGAAGAVVGTFVGNLVNAGWYAIQKPIAAAMNLWTDFTEREFKNQLVGSGAWAKSVLSMWASKTNDSFIDDRELLKFNERDRVRLFRMAERMDTTGASLASKEMMLQAMLLPVGQQASTGLTSQSIAWQFSVVPQIMTLTASANRMGGLTRYAFTVQGPVQLPFGMTLSMPIGYRPDPNGDGTYTNGWDPRSWEYVPGSTLENLSYLGIYYKGLQTAGQGLGKFAPIGNSNLWKATGALGRGVAGVASIAPNLLGSAALIAAQRGPRPMYALLATAAVTGLGAIANTGMTVGFDAGWAIPLGVGAAVASQIFGVDWKVERALTSDLSFNGHNVKLDAHTDRATISTIMANFTGYGRKIAYLNYINSKGAGMSLEQLNNTDIGKLLGRQLASFKAKEKYQAGQMVAHELAEYTKSVPHTFGKKLGKGLGIAALGIVAFDVLFSTTDLFGDEGQRAKAYHQWSDWAKNAGTRTFGRDSWLGLIGDIPGQWASNFFDTKYRVHVDPFDGTEAKSHEYGDTTAGATTRSLTRGGWFSRVWDRVERLFSKTIYLGAGNEFVSSGSFGFVFDRDSEGRFVWAKTFTQPSIMGFSVAYATGLVDTKRRWKTEDYFSAMNAIAAKQDLSNGLEMSLRMRKKAAVIGSMFHRNSAVGGLSTSGKIQMFNRTETTRWMLSNNNGFDTLRYFYMRHDKRGSSLIDAGLIGQARDRGGIFQTMKDEGTIRSAKKAYEIFKSVRDQAMYSGTLGEVNWESYDSLTSPEDYYNAGAGVNAYTLHAQAFQKDWSLWAGAAWSIAVGIIGLGIIVKNLTSSGLTKTELKDAVMGTARDVLADKPGHMYMSSFGLNAGHLGVEKIGDNINFMGGPQHNPSHRLWFMSVGNQLYTYGGAAAHFDDPFRGTRHALKTMNPTNLFGKGFGGPGTVKAEVIDRFKANLQPNFHEFREFFRIATNISDVHSVNVEARGALRSFEAYKSVVDSLGALTQAVDNSGRTVSTAYRNLSKLVLEMERHNAANPTERISEKVLNRYRVARDLNAAVRSNLLGMGGLKDRIEETLGFDDAAGQHKQLNLADLEELTAAAKAKMKEIDETVNRTAGGSYEMRAKLFDQWLHEDPLKDPMGQRVRASMESIGNKTKSLSKHLHQSALTSMFGLQSVSSGFAYRSSGGAYTIAENWVQAQMFRMYESFDKVGAVLSGSHMAAWHADQLGRKEASIMNAHLEDIANKSGQGSKLAAAFRMHYYEVFSEEAGIHRTTVDTWDEAWKRMEQYGGIQMTDDVEGLTRAASEELRAAAKTQLSSHGSLMLRYGAEYVGRGILNYGLLTPVSGLMQAMVLTDMAKAYTGVALGFGVAARQDVHSQDRIIAAQQGLEYFSHSSVKYGFVNYLGAAGGAAGYAASRAAYATARAGAVGATSAAGIVGGFVKAGFKGGIKAAGVGLAAIGGATSLWAAGSAGLTGFLAGTAISLGNPLVGIAVGAGAAAASLGGRQVLAGGLAAGIGYMATDMAWDFTAFGRTIENWIDAKFRDKGGAVVQFFDEHPWLAAGAVKAADIAVYTQQMRDAIVDKMASYGHGERNPGLVTSFVSGLGKGLRSWGMFSTFDVKSKVFHTYYNVESERGSSASLDPAKWRMPGQRKGFTSGSAFFAAHMTPLWHGSFADATNAAISEQDAITRTSDPNNVVKYLFRGELMGQATDPADSVMTSSVSRNASFANTFGSLSKFGDATKLMLSIRGEATQHQLARLLDRRDVWGNDTKNTVGLTGELVDDGYGKGLKHTNTSGTHRVRFAFTAIAGTTEQIISGNGGYLPSGLVGDGTIAHPLGLKGIIASGFGPRTAPRTAGGGHGSTNHKGIDIGATTGTPIYAAMAGTVTYAGWASGYGYLTIIQHADGTTTRYGHQSKITAQLNQVVSSGQMIGKVGSTGISGGSHLHFEIRDKSGKAINPMSFLEESAKAERNIQRVSAGGGGGRVTKGTGGTAQWADYINDAASRRGVDPNLVRAVMQAESGGVNHRPNFAGAVGLMQVVPHFHGYSVHQMMDPRMNIEAGVKILADNLRYFKGDIALAVAAYNAGAGAVNKYGGIPPYKETQNYVPRVLGYYLKNKQHPIERLSKKKRAVEPTKKKATTVIGKLEDHGHLKDNHVRLSFNKQPVGAVVYVDAATQRRVVTATYPDGTHWESIWDAHAKPNSDHFLIDNHALS